MVYPYNKYPLSNKKESTTGKESESKNELLRPHENKKLLHRKGNSQLN